MRGPRLTLLTLIFLSMALGQRVAIADAATLRPYSAEYSLQMGKIVVGKILITLEITDKGEYTYHAHTRSAGLAALFRNDEITEISRGVIEDSEIIPSNYFYHQVKKKRVREVSLDFDWHNLQVSNHAAGSLWTMDIPSGTQDKFSQQLALMSHLAGSGNSTQFQVADGGLLKTYRFEPQGKSRLRVKAGQYNAIKLTHSKDDRPAQSTFWLAPELHYLPIKIIKQEKDGEFTVELRQVTWNSTN